MPPAGPITEIVGHCGFGCCADMTEQQIIVNVRANGIRSMFIIYTYRQSRDLLLRLRDLAGTPFAFSKVSFCLLCVLCSLRSFSFPDFLDFRDCLVNFVNRDNRVK